MDKLKSIVKSVWANDSVRRVIHSTWQAAGGVLLAGLVAAHSSTDVKAAFVVAGAAALAALKAALVARS
jgi:hypothetical protein